MSHSDRCLGIAVVALALFLASLGDPPGAASAVVKRVSVASDGAQATDGSFAPALSADGRFVAFESFATNLMPGDTNGELDVFVHDRMTGLTSRVSVGPGGAQANGFSASPALSADGRFVAFYSAATNLVPGDTNGETDVFVHDRMTGLTSRVSVGPGGVQADERSFNPALSADGRFVAFDSSATNLVPGDTNGQEDVFVHDRMTGLTSRVSVGPGGAQAMAGPSSGPRLSADGRFVAFDSSATNLVPGDTNGQADVFVHDRMTGLTSRVSVGPGGVQANERSFNPALSADGRFVAFRSSATNLVPGDTNGRADVFVHDRMIGLTSRVSVGPGGAQATGGGSFDPALSGDGRFVAFRSFAPNLVPGDTNGDDDVFVHDRMTGLTSRVSVGPGGAQATGGSSEEPALSGDGRFVAFNSNATNLVPGDTNALYDIFLARLAAGPTWVATGVDAGGGPHVRGFDALGQGSALNRFAYGVAFTGGVRVAMGDVNGDGVADLVTAPGPGGGPHVRVFSGADPGVGLASLFAYGPTFTGGVYVAAGDVDGDGKADIVTGAGAGGGPHVRVFSGANPAVGLASLFPYAPGFTGGVRVAAGDVDGDGKADIITGPGPGGGPHVRVFSGANPAVELANFFAFAPGFTGGIFVAAGDVNGDGRADILVGADAGGGPHVRVFSGANPAVELASFLAFTPGFTGGVRVAAGDVDGDGKADIVTGAGPGGGPHVRVFSGASPAQEILGFFAYGAGFLGGTFLAGIAP